MMCPDAGGSCPSCEPAQRLLNILPVASECRGAPVESQTRVTASWAVFSRFSLVSMLYDTICENPAHTANNHVTAVKRTTITTLSPCCRRTWLPMPKPGPAGDSTEGSPARGVPGTLGAPWTREDSGEVSPVPPGDPVGAYAIDASLPWSHAELKMLHFGGCSRGGVPTTLSGAPPGPPMGPKRDGRPRWEESSSGVAGRSSSSGSMQAEMRWMRSRPTERQRMKTVCAACGTGDDWRAMGQGRGGGDGHRGGLAWVCRGLCCLL